MQLDFFCKTGFSAFLWLFLPAPIKVCTNADGLFQTPLRETAVTAYCSLNPLFTQNKWSSA